MIKLLQNIPKHFLKYSNYFYKLKLLQYSKCLEYCKFKQVNILFNLIVVFIIVQFVKIINFGFSNFNLLKSILGFIVFQFIIFLISEFYFRFLKLDNK